MNKLNFWGRLSWAVKYVITGDWTWEAKPLVITTSYRRVDHE